MSVQVYHNFLSGIKSILIFIDFDFVDLPPGRTTIYRAVPCPPARDAHGDDHGTTSGTRAAGDVGPYHVRRARAMCDVPVPNVSRPGLHGRARRPRRATHMEASTGRTRDDIGDDTGTRAAGDVGPYHVQRPRAERVASGIAWSGATSPARRAHGGVHGTHMGRHRGRHGDAGRRGRRPLPCATCPCRVRRARAECDVPVPNVSRPGLHGRAQVWRARRWGRATGGRRSPRCGRSCRGRRRGGGGRRARASPPPPSHPPP